ncbi:MAG: hypothetical protein J7L77_07080 [Clostridiales bacterium]|nr:hypothetical protein [Clostridiales bacterium]
MIEKTTNYSLEQQEALVNLVTNDSLIINHVVMRPNQSFPSHITEHDLNIIITAGQVSISLDDQQKHTYNIGQMVSIPKGVMSGISNPATTQTELFVIKSIK